MVIHEDCEAVELRQQDVARGHDAPGAVRDMLGGAPAQRQRGAAAEQRAVDSPMVRRFVVDDTVVELAQRRLADELAQHEGVLHLRESHGVGQAPIAVRNTQQRLGDGVAFRLKTAFGPVLRLVFGTVVEEVLHVPKHDQERILLRIGPERKPEHEGD